MESTISTADFECKFQTWLSQSGPRLLLKQVLSAPYTQRAKRLALSLINQTHLSFTKEFDLENHKGALVTCFKSLLSLRETELSEVDIDHLCKCVITWALPEVIPRVLKLRQRGNGHYTDLSGLFPNGDVLCTRAGRSPRTVAVLLKHGAPPGTGLIHAVDGYTQASQTGKDCESAESWILMLLSHGADPNMVLRQTLPLTIAEHATSQCPEMAALLRDWIDDTTSQEIMKIYENSCDPHTVSSCSTMAKEIVLLAAVRHPLVNLDLVRQLLESGTNPDVPSLCPSAEVELAVVDGTEARSGTSREDLWRSKRPLFGFNAAIPRPIDEAFNRHDASTLLVLLEAGSCPLGRMLEPVQSAALLPTAPLIPEEKTVVLLNEIMVGLLSSNYLNRISRVLMQHAVQQEDAGLIRQLMEKDVELHQCNVMGLSFSYITEEGTPFLDAVIRSSLRFAQEVWRLDPRFLDAQEQGQRARELVIFFDSIDPTDPELEQKTSFLLEVGAELNAQYRGNRACPSPPSSSDQDAKLSPV